MPDIKLLDILKIMCKVMGNEAGSKFDFQRTQPSNAPSCKANMGLQIKTDTMDLNDANSNMPDYFRSSINRTADKRASQVIMHKYTIK